MRLSERMDILIDRFCFGYYSLVTGYRVDIPPRGQKERGARAEIEICPPLRLADANIAFEPYGYDTPRSHGTWPHGADFAGAVAMYILFKDSLERERLPYRPSYRGTGGGGTGGYGNVER